ncbi:MAG: DNA primase small subunit PriS [Candidatus Bathyarchaeia archaeon]
MNKNAEVTEFSQDFIYTKFSEFYKNPSTEIPVPASINKREFAFLLLKEKIMLRHKSFADINNLKAFIINNIPSDVYYSCAYYENPAADMDKKGWNGADLVFDIDADHIPTSCNKIHDEWVCSKCGFCGKGVTPESCPICQGQKFDTKTWPCDLCLDSAKYETAKLIDILEKDFGFSPKELQVFFSGHRGFHVHVENEAVQALEATARKEIVDYILGTGLVLLNDKASKQTKRQPSSSAFSLHDFGWNRRIKVGMKKFIQAATKEDLQRADIRNYKVILQNKDTILKRCLEEGRWTIVKGLSTKTWKRIADYVKNLESAKIDTVVTTDIHRLIRMPGTLHGKTGLKKIGFPAHQLMNFDPFTEAVAFKEGTANVFVFDAPEFRLSGEKYGPYRHQSVELPTAAAVLLICKDRAKLVK